ncbi:lymphocyte antigen 6 complex locus protein G6d-like [Hyperolius riggenbachi]|uniref:lymphocyte antigen 6 complex locus protein G6d-like n=1 Tax=Hyperolius riggenbachi TaxID=752182 RepID=UPI0035A26EAE
MNKWAVIGFLAVLAGHLGDGLQCYTCNYDGCSYPSIQTCGASEVCLTQTAKQKDLYLQRKFCASSTECVEEAEDNILGVDMKTTIECCSEHLCNSAVKTSVSVATGIAVLVSLWAAKLL